MSRFLFLFSIFGVLVLTSCSSSISSAGKNGAPAAIPEAVLASVSRYNTEFSEAAYQTALAEKKTVFLNFHADWCSVCAANKPHIKAAFQELNDANMVGFQVDYDNSQALKKQFGITMQSSFVLIPNGDTTAFKKLGPGQFKAEAFLEFLKSA